jgi:Methane oxygenase PmoA
MKKVIFFLVFLSLLSTIGFSQHIGVIVKSTEQRVEIMADGKPFTSLIFPSDTVLKKFSLFPIYTPKGTAITRGYPIMPKAGERVDHPHHVGAWLNYESVNGFDFWNNSNAIKDRSKYGTIKNTKIVKAKSGAKKGELVVKSDWITADAKGTTVLKEKTNFTFQKKGEVYIIDRTTTLTAQKETVVFKDVKDGFFAIRVARELEHPSDKADSFVDANGIVTKVDKLDNTYITGKYRSSEGIEGEAVWSTRAKWVNLSGNIKGEDISLCIIDHPKNLNYPTYWHARGYGLFAANPLGEKVFSNGKKELNLTLMPKKSVTFRYRTVIASSKLTDAEINALAAEYK